LPISGRNLAEAAPPAGPEPTAVRIGEVTVELARHAVHVNGRDTPLRPRSMDVLAYLVRHAGRVVSKQELIEAVWADVAVTDDSLVQCMVEIRRALGSAHDAIRTIRGRGYLLDLDHGIHTGPQPAAARAAVEPESGPDPTTATTAAPDPSPLGRRLTRRTFAALATVAVLAIGMAVGGLGRWPRARAQVSPQETMNVEARQALADGLALLRQSRAQVDLQRARQLFARAVQLDDGFAAGHAALANVLVILSGFGVERPLDVLPVADAAARRAVALDATLAAGWQALAHAQVHWQWDWRGAEQSYRRALALDPASPFNTLFAHLLVGVGRADEAVAESDRWLAVDPASTMRLGSNCIVKYLARQPAAALRSCDRALALDATYSLAQFWRALALSELGEYDEAMRSALASRRAMGFAPTWVVGYVHARAGRGSEAREVLRTIEARAASSFVPAIDVAFVHAALGDIPQALDWLERAYREHGPRVELLAAFPPADPLRGEPRFRALLQKLRLSVAP
jgi:DNA-binding winged helix-turn-helix (wHTH) protein/tetratricopeptide (TPR) repeat protein